MGASPTPNHASSNATAAAPAEAGWNISRTTADRAPPGARSGPTVIAVHPVLLTASPVTVRICRPLPSLDAYHAIRRNASPVPATSRACAEASYHSPPSTVTAW